MPGFVRVTEKTPNVAGHDLRPYSNPGGGALFGDGLDGVEEFAVALENGTYHHHPIDVPQQRALRHRSARLSHLGQ